jgi:predicted MPP superfamily phosphohydrolase
MLLRLILWLAKLVLASWPGRLLLRRANQLSIQNFSYWVEINRIELELPRLEHPFDGYRLVLISDFHIGTWLDRTHLQDAINLVNAEHPDLVAITGDFVTYRPEDYAKDLVAVLGQIQAPDGVLAVLGNHDHWSNPKVVRRILQRANIRELRNDHISIKRQSASLHVAGVDDWMEALDDLDRVLSNLPADGCAILLAHEPDYADTSAKTGRFDLQLSGHTHGGQIHLPVFKTPILPRMGRKYPSGLYRVENMYQYTNRGLGTAELQFRFNCQPEITVLTLKGAAG